MKNLNKEHMRKPADPEEELRWMSQEVRGYVEAVLNSLAANVPKVGLYIPEKLCFCNYSILFFLLTAAANILLL